MPPSVQDIKPLETWGTNGFLSAAKQAILTVTKSDNAS
jgi:hypothetical protein